MTHYDDLIVENENLKHEVEVLTKKLQIAELSAEVERKKREKLEAQASARSPYPWATWSSVDQQPMTVHGNPKSILDKLDEVYQRMNGEKGKHEA